MHLPWSGPLDVGVSYKTVVVPTGHCAGCSAFFRHDAGDARNDLHQPHWHVDVRVLFLIFVTFERYAM